MYRLKERLFVLLQFIKQKENHKYNSTMKKKVTLIIVLTSMVIMAYADNITNLVIKQKAGTETILSLESNRICFMSSPLCP